MKSNKNKLKKRKIKGKTKKLVFKSHNLGKPLDNLTRDDFYDDPR